MVCEKGEAAISGSFWTNPILNSELEASDQLRGEKRLQKLNRIEQITANGAAYLPIWLVQPRAWAQNNLSEPEFDGSGNLLMDQLRKLQ